MADKSDKLKGRLKEVAGKATGNEKLESEGKAQRAKGTVHDKVDDVKDRIEGTVEGLRDSDRSGPDSR
ncbi:MAG TPA: CsbD family protein [Candidatus Stackebrandtia excrementipullorum]|nr:CsbD family protein [Candidatus Stackebrandtia excrementipullorum]